MCVRGCFGLVWREWLGDGEMGGGGAAQLLGTSWALNGAQSWGRQFLVGVGCVWGPDCRLEARGTSVVQQSGPDPAGANSGRARAKPNHTCRPPLISRNFLKAHGGFLCILYDFFLGKRFFLIPNSGCEHFLSFNF